MSIPPTKTPPISFGKGDCLYYCISTITLSGIRNVQPFTIYFWTFETGKLQEVIAKVRSSRLQTIIFASTDTAFAKINFEMTLAKRPIVSCGNCTEASRQEPE